METDANNPPVTMSRAAEHSDGCGAADICRSACEQGVDLQQTSYRENSSKEMLIQALAEKLSSQHPNRRPLLLSPPNEYGVQKFVSTTLRNSLLPHPQLYHWADAASFVSDYLSLVPLDTPSQLPKVLYSPTLVLKTQRGTCFDFTILLCSVLLGAGYDAYCISGYAEREICLCDQTHQECPLLAKQESKTTVEPEKSDQKYRVKPSRELRSSFLQTQEEQAETQAALPNRPLEEHKLLPPDPLHGLRVHSWVLVKSGMQDIPEDFFIEPLSGRSFSTTCHSFLGIESVWNHQNYWVNLQDCTYGCREMTYDLADVEKWSSLLLPPDSEEEEDDCKIVEMPLSWVDNLHISQEDLETSFPGGMKVIQYKKAKLEKFVPCLKKDGLVMQVTTYSDLDCKHVFVLNYWFKNRQDCLEEREIQMSSGVKTDRFRPGRPDFLKTHRYLTLSNEGEWQMEFYKHGREDGLVQIVVTSNDWTETFDDNFIFTSYRNVTFAENKKRLNRSVQKITERFRRDRSKTASHDVAEQVFLLSEDRIHLTYHLENNSVIPAETKFIKPRDTTGNLNLDLFTSEMVSTFQPDPFQKPKKNLFLYQQLKALIEEEQKVLNRINTSQVEVSGILLERKKEERNILLELPIFENTRIFINYRNKHLQMEKSEQDILAPLWHHLIELDSLSQDLQLAPTNNFSKTQEDDKEEKPYVSNTINMIKRLQHRLN
ncbi:dynein regulatory complex subunit 7 isoform X2 [Denticeps clupeoides]|uniref:Dynein regulatory complex subunit 7 n=1 Tax=Denticeps clupeoides TaxID=299321 RepID=A0AAY4DJY9_9TELE|nr:dynein regulatory complex subunit 7 isoform X2 [Denticeps clupeoides]